ncbi:MAG: hypothetical protein ACOC10_08930 [Bacteroidota bacterium]
MKDIVITGKRIKTELIYLLVSFIIGIGLNIYAIVKYNTHWKELVTQLWTVFVFSLVIYLIVLILRLIVFGVISLFSLGKNKS